MQHAGAERFTPGGVVLLRLRSGLIESVDSFIDPAVCRRFSMPDELA
jgi:RNA polymerase sigma-70 factor (ECF subfamily)